MTGMTDDGTAEGRESHSHAPDQAAAPVEQAPTATHRIDRVRAAFRAPEAPPIVTAVAALLATAAALYAVAVTSTQADSQQASFQSAQWCKDYRDEVLALREHNLSPQQIRAWLRTEPGLDPDQSAYDEKSTKCNASVCTLVAQVPPPLSAPPDCFSAEAREQQGK